MAMERYTQMPPSTIEEAWNFYERTFSPLEELAAFSQLLGVGDFVHMCMNRRIVKYVRRIDGLGIVGMTVHTNVLSAWRWPHLSVRYFAKHWPKEYERGAIWWVGFVGADSSVQPGICQELLAELAAPVKAVGGMAFMDYCGVREELGLPRGAEAWARNDNPRAHVARVDHQAVWSISYPPLSEETS